MESFLAKLPRIPTKWILLLSVIVLAAIAFLIRCLHLFDANHYYIIAPDSYFFDWVTRGIMAGQPPPASPGGEVAYTLHRGLAYPLAYLAEAVRYVFGSSPADALNLVSKFLPPVMAVISAMLIYLFAARISNRRVGLLSALAWAVMPLPVVFGAAGYLDRDGLSMLLFMTGAFLFYLSGVWHFKIGGRDVGWLIAGAGVLVMEALLYIEWSFAGPVLLLAVIAAYFVVRFLLEYLGRMETKPDVRRRLAASIGVVNWRAFALIVVANALVVGVNFYQDASWWDFAVSLVQSKGETKIMEMQGLSFADLTAFGFFIIPMVLGLYVAWKKRAESSIFFCCWFIVLLVLAIFSKRILLYATPAACLLCGVGLASLWDWMKQGLFHVFKRIGMAVLLGLALVTSFTSAAEVATPVGMSPDRGWQDALAYLRSDETPKDSVIMSQWSWGYWILDLGQRRPLVDNGYYGYDADRLRDIGLAYSTTDPAEAARIMEKYGANYLVLSKLDLNYATTIMEWANVGEGLGNFLGNSLVMRSINGEFESGGGLEVVYRSPPEPNAAPSSEADVVILGLTQT
jgi:asparagine N-glycosylation enzyme membrane subunit Stt3